MMSRYQVSVGVQVYFEVEAESREAAAAIVGDALEDMYFADGGSKSAGVDMRTADWDNPTVYDEVES